MVDVIPMVNLMPHVPFLSCIKTLSSTPVHRANSSCSRSHHSSDFSSPQPRDVGESPTAQIRVEVHLLTLEVLLAHVVEKVVVANK